MDESGPCQTAIIDSFNHLCCCWKSLVANNRCAVRCKLQGRGLSSSVFMFQLSTWIEKICWVMRCIRKMQPEVKVILFLQFGPKVCPALEGDTNKETWQLSVMTLFSTATNNRCFGSQVNHKRSFDPPCIDFHYLSLLFGWKTPRLVRVARCRIGMMQSPFSHPRPCFQVREGCRLHTRRGYRNFAKRSLNCSLRVPSGLGSRVGPWRWGVSLS